MKFTIENVGPVKKATIEMGKLTVICGKNNTGKTTITNTIFEFYKLFRRNLSFRISTNKINFPIEIDLVDYASKAATSVRAIAKKFSKLMLENGTLKVSIKATDFPVSCPAPASQWKFDNIYFEVKKKGSILHIDRKGMPEEDEKEISKEIQAKLVSAIIKSYLFDQKNNDGFFADSFSSMSERTGLIAFKKHINIANAFIANRIKQGTDEAQDVTETTESKNLLLSVPLSVMTALSYCEVWNDHTPTLTNYQKQFLDELNELVEGEYSIEKDTFYYTPNTDKKQKLRMNVCSSSVKSLLLLDFYIRYMAEKGDVLIIDEPELNLHPQKQRQLARFLGTLVNAGIKVFITTHSDYIIREFNTMIQLKQNKVHVKKIREVEGYPESHLLVADDVRAYISEKQDNDIIFKEVKISQNKGMAISTLDDVINAMNSIQDAILWGE